MAFIFTHLFRLSYNVEHDDFFLRLVIDTDRSGKKYNRLPALLRTIVDGGGCVFGVYGFLQEPPDTHERHIYTIPQKASVKQIYFLSWADVSSDIWYRKERRL